MLFFLMIHHGICSDYDLVAFKENKSMQEITDWLENFEWKVESMAGNRHLQFIV